MATNFKLKEKMITFFEKNSDQQATCGQIAEWISGVKEYQDDCNKKIASTKINDKELPGQLRSEIGSWSNKPYAQSALSQAGLKRVKIEDDQGKHVWGFCRTKLTPTKTKSSKSSSKTINPKPKTNKKPDEKEKRMYNPLMKFLREQHKIGCKRIDHRTSKGSEIKRQWLYPDLVGLQDLSKGWDHTLRAFVRRLSDKMCKLWSFELKKEITGSDVRACFFQAVSNSSWANFGYLVACEIDDASLKQLRILSSLHGIGFIQLNIKKPQASQIIIPAQEKKEIDWDTVNGLTDNADFQKYISLVEVAYDSGSDKQNLKWDSDS